MADRSAVKFCECIEEMIVSACSGRRHEAAHRKSVDQCIIKMLIREGSCSRRLSFAAIALRRLRTRGSLRPHERVAGEIDAQSILGGVANPGLGINRSAQMVVQVRA